MPISYRPKGEAAYARDMGSNVARHQEAVRRSEQAERHASQLRDFEFRREAQVRDLEFREQSAEYQANLDFQAKQAAQAWELVKAQRRSEHDFELEEIRYHYKVMEDIQKEVKKRAEKQAKLDALEKAYTSGTLDKKRYDEKRLSLETDLPTYESNAPRPATQMTPSQQYGVIDKANRFFQNYREHPRKGPQMLVDDEWMPANPQVQQIAQLYGNALQGNVGGGVRPPDTSGDIWVRHPDGREGQISANEWPQAQAEGYVRI